MVFLEIDCIPERSDFVPSNFILPKTKYYFLELPDNKELSSFLNNKNNYSTQDYFVSEVNNILLNSFERDDAIVNKAVLQSLYSFRENFEQIRLFGCLAACSLKNYNNNDSSSINALRYERSVKLTNNLFSKLSLIDSEPDFSGAILVGLSHLDFVHYFVSKKYAGKEVRKVNFLESIIPIRQDHNSDILMAISKNSIN
jgi:hypothetical protein